jgi:hypothetical protein
MSGEAFATCAVHQSVLISLVLITVKILLTIKAGSRPSGQEPSRILEKQAYYHHPSLALKFVVQEYLEPEAG